MFKGDVDFAEATENPRNGVVLELMVVPVLSVLNEEEEDDDDCNDEKITQVGVQRVAIFLVSFFTASSCLLFSSYFTPPVASDFIILDKMRLFIFIRF